MTTMREYRCEICGIVDTRPIHWFVILCGDSQLSVLRWNSEAANAVGARHFCGEAHAEVYISRWFDRHARRQNPISTFRHQRDETANVKSAKATTDSPITSSQ